MSFSIVFRVGVCFGQFKTMDGEWSNNEKQVAAKKARSGFAARILNAGDLSLATPNSIRCSKRLWAFDWERKWDIFVFFSNATCELKSLLLINRLEGSNFSKWLWGHFSNRSVDVLPKGGFDPWRPLLQIINERSLCKKQVFAIL